MEKSKQMNMEEYAAIGSSSSFPSCYSFPSVFDFSEDNKSSLGFMELLGVQQNYGTTTTSSSHPLLLDLAIPSSNMPMPVAHIDYTDPVPETGKQECSEVLTSQQQPATPNSSSISSASSEAVNDEQNKTVDQANQPHKLWVLFLLSFSLFSLFIFSASFLRARRNPFL